MITTAKKSDRLIPFLRRFCSPAAVSEDASVVTAEVPAAPQPGKDDRLYRRLSASSSTLGSASKVLNQFVREGRIVKKYELDRCVKELRRYKKYSHALETMEWMAKRGINFSSANHAIFLDLISKTKGVPEAEKYFNSLPESFRDQSTYGAMLNVYCHEKRVEKAIEHFKKMEELNYADTALATNNFMSLFMRRGEFDKVLVLFEKMKEKNVEPTTFTYNIVMNAFASMGNMNGAENVLEEMKRNAQEKCDWTTYSNMASFYVRAGLFEEAETALKEVENLMRYRDRQAYHFMISLYAGTSNLSQVKRIWEVLKTALPVTNNLSYLVMLQALEKLNDYDGLKGLFEEWRSVTSYYDMRLANVAIRVHLRQNMLEDAEFIFNEACEKTKGALFKAREMFMEFFLRNSRIDPALRHMEAAVSEVKGNRLPSKELVISFFMYLEEHKDVERAEELFKMLKKLNWDLAEAYTLLLKTYVAAAKTSPDMQRRIEEDGIETSPELNKMLGLVSEDNST